LSQNLRKEEPDEVLKMKWQMFKGCKNQNMESIIPLPTWNPTNVAGTVRYKLDITAIQEMRWIGEGFIEKTDHVLFYSCQRTDHIVGKGFIINKRIKHLIMDFKAKSSRMC
jgi:hypothetical protein